MLLRFQHALVIVLLTSSIAFAQTTLINGLGGTAGYGTSCLGGNDDGSSRAISLAPVFPMGIQFFTRMHTQMFVNTNGNVSFSGEVSTYTPAAFPVADQPMIAPFWADVDIRGTACVGPDGGSGYAGDCTNPGENGVWWALDTVGRRVVVTWDRVGYYDCKVDRRMSFQLVLTPAPTVSCGGGAGDFDVEFRFNRCEWNTGDASGGTGGLVSNVACVGFPPILPYQCPIDPTIPCVGGRCSGVAGQSGFDAGDRTNYVEIPGSRTNTIHTILCTMSNVDEPGVWRYQIRSGVVVCPDAGMECSTGMMGVCGAGRTQCVGGGTECRPEVMASPERCDALDNDCNGTVDDGSGLCPSGQVCDLGTCVGACFEGGCLAGQSCTASGRCVDTGCESITCPAGQRCAMGRCVGACDGVVCPAGQMCRGGRCVDLCAGAICDDCTVCVDGTCTARCQFASCPGGQTCLADGRCIEASCASVTCPMGEVCRAGTCVDACMGATCPRGEMCVAGMCVPEVRPDAGPMIVPDGGTLPEIDAGPRPGNDASVSMVDGGVDAGRRAPGGRGGCGCRSSGGSIPLSGAFVALAIVAIVRRRRR